MRIFKIILGIIIIALGLGMAAAGWAVAAHGRFAPLMNAFFGFSLGFMGIVGLVGAGVMLVRGSAIRDVLGGIVTAQPGLSASSRKKDTYYLPPDNIKDLLIDIFTYTVAVIAVILLAIFSVFRVTGGFPFDK